MESFRVRDFRASGDGWGGGVAVDPADAKPPPSSATPAESTMSKGIDRRQSGGFRRTSAMLKQQHLEEEERIVRPRRRSNDSSNGTRARSQSAGPPATLVSTSTACWSEARRMMRIARRWHRRFRQTQEFRFEEEADNRLRPAGRWSNSSRPPTPRTTTGRRGSPPVWPRTRACRTEGSSGEAGQAVSDRPARKYELGKRYLTRPVRGHDRPVAGSQGRRQEPALILNLLGQVPPDRLAR